jgi:hypothetical protein
MDPREGQQPINVPYRYDDQPGGGGMPPGQPPYHPYVPYQPPPAARRMSRSSWVALAVVAVLLVIMGGWYAWGSYQNNQAKKIPLYPGAHLIPSSVYAAGSG